MTMSTGTGKSFRYGSPISVTHPEVAAQWARLLNGKLTADDVSAGSRRMVWWRCKRRHVWEARVYARTAGSGCPSCAGFYSKPLSVTHPELAAQWHPTRNDDLTPDLVTAGSDRRVWWLCERLHEWQATVGNRARGTGCPDCRKVLVTERWPELAEQWHPTRNVGMVLETLTVWDLRPVWWLCDRGHEWEATVHSRGRGKGLCPECVLDKRSLPVLALTVRQDLRAEWHPTLNVGIDLETLTTGDPRWVWWLCRAAHEWQAPVAARLPARGCLLCAGRRYLESLSVTHPEVAAEWHPVLNGDLTPDQFTAGSSARVAWLCPLGHEWNTRIDTRTFGKGSGCPKCDPGRRHYRRESLAVERPELAAQWHPTLNGDRTPHDVTAGSGRKVWWRCEAGDDHVWQARIAQRTKGSGCRKCAGFYDKPMSVTHPERAAEWHPTLNGDLTPDDVTAGSPRKVWWLCPKERHEWFASVNNHQRAGCPECAAARRAQRLKALGVGRRRRQSLDSGSGEPV